MRTIFLLTALLCLFLGLGGCANQAVATTKNQDYRKSPCACNLPEIRNHANA